MAPRRGLHWPPLAIFITGLLSMGPVEILAQTSSVVCGSSFNWMNNSKNQNPCVVAAYLQGACNNGQFTVNPLPLYSYYSGPSADQQDDCQCSTLTYNTMSACGACQNRGFIGWNTWAYNCTTLYLGVFLPGIPVGTAVPAWAFQDVAITYGFNVTLAQSVGDNPESTGTPAQSTGSLSATSTSPSASLTDSASVSSRTSSPPTSSAPIDTSTPTSSGSSSNTGAIAGGIVGGVVGVALIAVAIVFKRKKPPQIPPSEPASPPPSYTDTTPFYSQMVPPRLYDPSDPSTFPTPAPPITVMTELSSNLHNSALNYSAHSVHPGGHYRGAPEL